MKRISAGILFVLLGAGLASAQQKKPELANPADRDVRRTTALMADEVRHQLVMLPYYDVFDWLEANVGPDGKVVLRGSVTEPSTKEDAEKRVTAIEGVASVENEIHVLRLSQMDNDLRRQLYRSIFNFDSPLFIYGIRAVPPIHIIVEGGRVTLKGLVRSDMDRQLAETAARSVPGTFEVTNELVVEK